MYSVNGIPLNNPELGWRMAASSKPLAEHTRDSRTIQVPGRDGIVGTPSTANAPILPIVVKTSKARLESLYALFLAPEVNLSLTAAPSRVATAEVLSTTYESLGPADLKVSVTFLLQVNGAFWRDAVHVTSSAVALTAASVLVSALTGLSAPVSDAAVRVKGQCGGLRVQDAGGSWFTYGANLPAGSYLRYHSDSAQAFVTTTDTWTGGTEVSGDIDFNGPRGHFELTPSFTDPAVRAAKLTVTTTSRAGATIEIRGKGAYLV